jgi:hypothetical protein
MLLSKPFPRKGTKTLGVGSRSQVRLGSFKTLSRKGTETQQQKSKQRIELRAFSKPFRRKATVRTQLSETLTVTTPLSPPL